MVSVTKIDAPCGAIIEDIDLSKPMDDNTRKKVRKAWMDHHVLVFPKQKLENEQLVAFAESIGPIGEDPYIGPIEGHNKIAAIHRLADETGRIFADNWHSDWTFMPTPPAGTCLYGITIPPEGGDTYFSNQHLAYDEMPADMKAKFENLSGIYSAGTAYAPDGAYAEDKFDGAMNIILSEEANKKQTHQVVRNHPETGRIGLFGGSYLVGIEGMGAKESAELLRELHQWQNQDQFVYRHKWEEGTLVLWDNRSVLHRASGGYEGYERKLHRLTIADDPAYY
ncbi:TauD/TfdA family dioxygenase [Sneathiella sp. P13V-1]|uniref:TauD/TfdA dioxygenase family protein n=1 Tax=Sneathiella sp. P13V-1 TaxID=2697366 RepID=UPI00187B67F7|nr:TauD/TfdA family dioxygenase [Sneathiella sp. P13V-1]MBE7638349.1 TauD/TfdA family dioxygenase [Sneathiella sp. P13V-1]